MRKFLPPYLLSTDRLVSSVFNETTEVDLVSKMRSAVEVDGFFVEGGYGDFFQRQSQRVDTLRVVREVLGICTVMVWDGEVLDAAVSDAEDFIGLEADITAMPYDGELWILDPSRQPSKLWQELAKGLEFSAQSKPPTDGSGRPLRLSAILVDGFDHEQVERERASDSPEQLALHRRNLKAAGWGDPGYLVHNENLLNITFLFDEPGRTESVPHIFSQTIVAEKITKHNAWIFAALKFTRQEIARKERIRTPGWKPCASGWQDPPLVNRIVLRRERSPSAEIEEEQNVATRKYRCRHRVREHLRRLAKPRKSDGVQVIVVKQHFKGPKGAPLLKPRVRVAHVRR